MHIKRIHEMMECLTEYAKCELDKAIECEGYDVNVIGGIIDMVKDLAEAEKDARIAKGMQEAEEEQEEEEKYMLRTLTEKMGEDDGRRFYDRWRYANGRFAPKGRGHRSGYTPYLFMPEDVYEDYPEMFENYRMGYSDGNMRNSDMRSGDYGRQGRTSERSGYGDGSGRGRDTGSKYGKSYDRYDNARRHYHDTKDMGSMKEMEESFSDILEDFGEVADDTWKDLTPEQKAKQKPKINQMIQKLQKLQQM